MKSKILIKNSLCIICVVGIVVSITAIFSSVFYPFVYSSSPRLTSAVLDRVPQNKGKSNPELPLRLKIPGINVNAPVIHIGVTSRGAMGTPKGPFDVAWFNLGPRPGEVGSAVIAGHYGRWKNGSGSVFDNLNRLKKGDKIYIEDKKGSIVTFVVRESKIYNPNANAADVFYSMDGKAHLNLITCEGIWDNVRKTYSNRLIVFTDKE